MAESPDIGERVEGGNSERTARPTETDSARKGICCDGIASTESEPAKPPAHVGTREEDDESWKRGKFGDSVSQEYRGVKVSANYPNCQFLIGKPK